MRHNFYTKLMNVDYFLAEGSCDRSTALVSLTRRSMKALWKHQSYQLKDNQMISRKSQADTRDFNGVEMGDTLRVILNAWRKIWKKVLFLFLNDITFQNIVSPAVVDYLFFFLTLVSVA